MQEGIEEMNLALNKTFEDFKNQKCLKRFLNETALEA
jgi:hypothetical protein